MSKKNDKDESQLQNEVDTDKVESAEVEKDVPMLKITNLKNIEITLNVGGITTMSAGSSIYIPRNPELEKVLKHFAHLKYISLKV